MLSVLPRFVVLEMINDMTNVEDEHLQHQFHKIYIHRYENVRWVEEPLSAKCLLLESLPSVVLFIQKLEIECALV